MSKKRFIVKEDLVWLSTRSFIKRDNVRKNNFPSRSTFNNSTIKVDTIWNELQVSESAFMVNDDDFDWLKKTNNNDSQTFSVRISIVSNRINL